MPTKKHSELECIVDALCLIADRIAELNQTIDSWMESIDISMDKELSKQLISRHKELQKHLKKHGKGF